MSYLTGAGGVRLRFSDRGPVDRPSAGANEARPVVLVHGWKGSHRLWDPVIARLQSDHRVVAFDLRGMGESDKPRCAYDFDELSDDLGTVIDTLGLPGAILVGWSMGTTVSLRYMERGGAGVAGIVIVNGPLRLTRAPGFPHAMTGPEFDRYLEQLRDEWPAGERAFQAATVLNPSEALVDWLCAIALQTPLDVAIRVVEHQARLDMRGAVSQIDVPVLAAYSRHDPYYPESLAHHIASTARKGRAVIFEHSAHCIPIEETARFCDVLREFSGELDR
jgi:non-heme chloroperoxidase